MDPNMNPNPKPPVDTTKQKLDKMEEEVPMSSITSYLIARRKKSDLKYIFFSEESGAPPMPIMNEAEARKKLEETRKKYPHFVNDYILLECKQIM